MNSLPGAKLYVSDLNAPGLEVSVLESPSLTALTKVAASSSPANSSLKLCVRVFIVCLGEGDGTPLQYSRLENPMDGGAWWAAVHGVAGSWT